MNIEKAVTELSTKMKNNQNILAIGIAGSQIIVYTKTKRIYGLPETIHGHPITTKQMGKITIDIRTPEEQELFHPSQTRLKYTRVITDVLPIYLRKSRKLQKAIRDMLKITQSSDATKDEKDAATETIAEILFPTGVYRRNFSEEKSLI